MKNTIMFYYNFDNPLIYRWNKKVYVKNKNEKYLFQEIYSEKELMEIFNLLKNDNKYYKFIPNKFNNLITIYKERKYVLLQIRFERNDYTQEVFNNNYVYTQKTELIRNNWYFLWTRKNDYFEYQINHILGKYPLIDESIDYFIGMAETAICYLNYNTGNIPNNNLERLSICHRRIAEDDFFNPLNIVVDSKERDIGEYLKHIFLNETYTDMKIKQAIEFCYINNLDFYKLYARVLYPSYYFDLYEEIINENVKEEELKKVIERTSEFEEYVDKIYKSIIKKVEIRGVDWIQKK